jgi:hypothetical protein
MARQDRIDLHARRALEELERAQDADSEAAAFAHLELSELHLAEMRTLREAPPGPPLRLVRSNLAPAPTGKWKASTG